MTDYEVHIKRIHRHLSGEFDETEEKQFSDWISQSDSNKKLFDEIKTLWEVSGKIDPLQEAPQSVNIDSALISTKKRIGKGRLITLEKSASKKTWNSLLRIAATFIVLISAYWFFFGQGAQLTEVDATALTEITLPDESVVWLNEGSSFKYPATFSEKQRKVYLEGEAYFEIRPDPERSFQVITRNAAVSVLGTGFNVATSSDKKVTEVQLLHGKVHFHSKKDKEKAIILEGVQAARYDSKNKEITEVEPLGPNAIAWKTDKLIFDNIPLQNVLEQSSKYYGVGFTLNNNEMEDCRFRSTLENQSVEDFIQELKLTFQFTSYEKAGNRYIFYGGKCQ